MTTTCATCSSALDEGTPVCPNCGTAVAASPGVVETAPSTAPIFKSFEDRNDLNGIGGWLILPAIGLAIAPFFALYGIFVTDLPMLTGSRYQIFLTGHPGIFGLLIFEIIVNALFLAGSLGLNFLFYKKHRLFPSYMIAYLVTQFFLLDRKSTRLNSSHLGISYAVF